MKTKEFRLRRLAVGIVAVGLWCGEMVVTPAQAQVDLSVDLNIQSPADFYSPLTPYGSWVNVGGYGRCWRPLDIPVGWRPYTLGHWEWTDAGWYWVSDEPFGWACYHYGQWIFDPAYGWVWLPGTEWAPAWVVWREAPDYIGWAPCGPGGVVVTDTAFVFVDVHHFHDRLRPRELVFNDPRILRRSRVVGGFRTEMRDWGGRSRRIVINQGPAIEPIQRATGTRFTQRPARELARQAPIPESVRRNSEPGIRRPEVNQQQPAQTTTGRQQQRIYREAPTTQPAPTGRQNERIYREVPSPQPSPRELPRPSQREVPSPQPAPRILPQPAPSEVPRTPVEPRRQNVPEAVAPPSVPIERTLPPTGREHGRSEAQVPRRPEQTQRAAEPPQVVPAPQPQIPPAAAPNTPPPRRDGHDGDKRDGRDRHEGE